ncbi:MAG: hypothetical protein EXR28_04445 [Betaproteobacteria bacterium]|nr:hypothetical protein [Betaproteobacteria bacterium]
MQIDGKTKLERMRDGREVWVGAERVTDVTTHPAFREAAKTVAALYDWKSDPARHELLTFEEGGERFAISWMLPRSREDLSRRLRGMKAIADWSYGLIGRTPGQVACLIAGLATKPSVLDIAKPGFGENLMRYYRRARHEDLYVTFAVVPPAGIRSADLFAGQAREFPSLRIVDEDDSGVFISGIKILATSAVYADEVFVGNLSPLDKKFDRESITCAMPVASPGLALWSRRPYGLAGAQIDYPLSYRYDETDSVLVCERVKVPWERVFLDSGANFQFGARQIVLDTPAMNNANHQSNVRFWSKMGLIAGVALRISEAQGLADVPAVKETLGEFAAIEAMAGSMAAGQVECCESWPEGYVSPNRRFQFATTYWCLENHNAVIEKLRTLLGGVPLQMPACVDVLSNPMLKEKFEAWWGTPAMAALDRMKLYKLAWDLVGSEFAGRHMLYERFYAGNPLVNRNHNYREGEWGRFGGMVDELLHYTG